MSAVQDNSVWSLPTDNVNPKHEKCLNITEEIYKRINITFEIKKLGSNLSDQSYHSDQIDSNELSNGTDLFACDKSDSIPSSTETEKPKTTCEKFININNNNEEVKANKPVVTVYKRPKKRFRKRVKKLQSKPVSDSDGSSDEALPLSRIVDVDAKCISGEEASEPEVMGVPHIIINTKDLKSKLLSPERKSNKKEPTKTSEKTSLDKEKGLKQDIINAVTKEATVELNVCKICYLCFKNDKKLRRHMSTAHITSKTGALKKISKSQQRDYKPA